MISAKIIIWFLLRLVLVEAILIVPWPGLAGAYRSFFEGMCTTVIDCAYVDRVIQFRPLQSPQGLLDIEATVINPGTGQRGTMPISSRHYGWMPTAFAIALGLAAPLAWKRRLACVIWMVVCTNILVIARVWIALQVNMSDPSGPGLMNPWPPFRAVLTSVDGAFSVPLIGWYVGPLMVWMFWIFAWEWSRLNRQETASTKPDDRDRTQPRKRAPVN